jgi:heme-binding protein
MTWKTAVGCAFAVALAGAQLYQPERANPPVDPAASFNAVARPHPIAAAALNRACRDCHSHETVWPWYSRVAPASWLVARDVRIGRAHLNLSEWKNYGPEMSTIRIRSMCEEVSEHKMPPPYYRPLHRGAGLTTAEVQALCGPAGS